MGKCMDWAQSRQGAADALLYFIILQIDMQVGLHLLKALGFVPAQGGGIVAGPGFQATKLRPVWPG